MNGKNIFIIILCISALNSYAMQEFKGEYYHNPFGTYDLPVTIDKEPLYDLPIINAHNVQEQSEPLFAEQQSKIMELMFRIQVLKMLGPDNFKELEQLEQYIQTQKATALPIIDWHTNIEYRKYFTFDNLHKTFNCTICSSPFITPNYIIQHLETKHSALIRGIDPLNTEMI